MFLDASQVVRLSRVFNRISFKSSDGLPLGEGIKKAAAARAQPPEEDGACHECATEPDSLHELRHPANQVQLWRHRFNGMLPVRWSRVLLGPPHLQPRRDGVCQHNRAYVCRRKPLCHGEDTFQISVISTHWFFLGAGPSPRGYLEPVR